MEAAHRSRPDARINGARVERQQAGLEVIVGVVRDPTFGAMVLLGMGGVAAEALDGQVFTPAPLSCEQAMGAIDRVPGLHHVLVRHGVGVDPSTELAKFLVAVSHRFLDAGLHELEMKPVAWTGERWIILDALVSE